MKKNLVMLFVFIVLFSGCINTNDKIMPEYQGNLELKKDDLMVIFNTDNDLSIDVLEDDVDRSLENTGISIKYDVNSSGGGLIREGEEYTYNVSITNNYGKDLEVKSFLLWVPDIKEDSIVINSIDSGSIDNTKFKLSNGLIEYDFGDDSSFVFKKGEIISISTTQRAGNVIDEEYVVSKLDMTLVPENEKAFDVIDRITLEAQE